VEASQSLLAALDTEHAEAGRAISHSSNSSWKHTGRDDFTISQNFVFSHTYLCWLLAKNQ